ncbi:MAG: substrate-binding domain-containing protein [Chloroflexi bacterium]|nr:substrate-binding domain-containing protein [Chloroflexota bacterium]
MKRIVLLAVLVLAALLIVACAATPTPVPPTTVPVPTQPPAPTAVPATKAPAPTVAASSSSSVAPTPTSIRAAIGTSGCHLILSTTTSTADSGLLSFILPDFEKKFNCKVDVVAVGTGAAIAIGQKGDADVLLVHDRPNEDKFVADKNARERFDVLYNDFIIVGPKNDPAKINGMKLAKDAFKAIMDTKSTFASRGDKSGTNSSELRVWATLGITPTKELSWYNALGQGMGDTLTFSNERGAYTLADRATWLAQQSKLSGLTLLVGGANISENADKDMYNPYGVMAVNPDKFPGVKYDMAMNFVKWITSVDEQKVINSFVDKFGQHLFYASSAEYVKSIAPASSSSSASSSTGSSPSSGGVILTITGLVGKETSFTMAQLQAMSPVTLNAEHPKN